MRNLHNLFNSDNTRTRIVKRNVYYSFGIKGVSIIISLLLVPMTINYVSSELYGIWLTLSSIIGWLSFFDVGFGLGLRNRLTTALALGDTRKGKIYVSTTYCILAIVFFIVGLLGYFFCGIINWCSLLNISAEYFEVLITVSRIVVFTFCASIIFRLIQNVFQAYQMTAVSSAVDTISQLFSLVLIYILTKTAFPSLNKLAFVFCGTPIFVYILFSLILYNKRFREVAPSFSSIDFKYVKDLFSLGSQFFLIQIICIILYQSVNFVISHFCGPEQVTVYNIGYKYLNCSLMIFNIIVAPLWSAYNDAFAKNDIEWMKSVYARLIKINLLFVLGIVLMVLISPIVYNLWVGDIVVVPYIVSILIGLYMVCQITSTMHASILNGMGIIKIQIIQAIVQGFVFIVALVILRKELDLTIILIIMLITAVIPVIVLPFQIKLILNNRAEGIWKK